MESGEWKEEGGERRECIDIESLESVRLCKIGSSEDVKVTLTGIY